MKLSSRRQVEYDILYKSLITKEIEIIDSPNKNLIGIKGILIYESANMFFINVENTIKKVLKNNVTIKIKYNNDFIKIPGSALLGTLVNRLKKIK